MSKGLGNLDVDAAEAPFHLLSTMGLVGWYIYKTLGFT